MIRSVKHCTGCDLDLPLDQFAWRNKSKGTRQSRCRGCQKTVSDSWYAENASRQKVSVARNSARYRAEQTETVRAAKSVPCTDCGRRFPPCAMDFDHVRGKKFFNIGRTVAKSRLSTARIMAEIAKCEVVCAVCHRIRTAERLGSDAAVLIG
ncbi:MAG TPA: hypothetical protein VGA04_27600 [Streptosporangiaceae bacterium]